VRSSLKLSWALPREMWSVPLLRFFLREPFYASGGQPARLELVSKGKGKSGRVWRGTGEAIGLSSSFPDGWERNPSFLAWIDPPFEEEGEPSGHKGKKEGGGGPDLLLQGEFLHHQRREASRWIKKEWTKQAYPYFLVGGTTIWDRCLGFDRVGNLSRRELA